VDYIANIWLVNSHAKRNGGTQYANHSIAPFTVPFLSLKGIELGVIEGNADTAAARSRPHLLLDLFRQLLTILSTQAVNNTGISWALRNIVRDCVQTLAVFLAHFVAKVWAVERGDVPVWVAHGQSSNGIVHDPFVRRGSQGHERNVWILTTQNSQSVISWAKVVSPIGEAMCFLWYEVG